MTASQETNLVRSVLVRLGAPEPEASVQATLLVEADLRDHRSHGLQRLPVLAQRLKAGLIRPAAHGKPTWIAESMLLVDGEMGFGPVVALDAIEQIGMRARSTGVAIAAVRNSNHLGMLGFYVEAIAKSGRIGIALTTGEALVHPFGGRQALLGANPIAIGIPIGAGTFVVDMATSVVSMGQVIEHLWRGELLPEGWALDDEGLPTRDPAAASKGSLAPFGGFKGYALGLALGLVVAAVTGGALGPEVQGTLDSMHVSNKGDVFICIDPNPTGSAPVSQLGLERYLQGIRDSSPQPGVERVDIPGDRSRKVRNERMRNGIPVVEAVWQACAALLEAT